MDIREETARLYDFQPFQNEDIEFYKRFIRSDEFHVLELGCGTGRVLVPLSKRVKRIRGIDISPGMIKVCKEKLTNNKIAEDKGYVVVGDIAEFALNEN